MRPPKSIVVGHDLSDRAQEATAAAFALAKRYKAEHLRIVHVVNAATEQSHMPYGYTSAQIEEVRKRARQIATERLEKSAPQAPEDVSVHYIVRLGSPSRELAKVAQMHSADLIVVSSHGRGTLGRQFLGSVCSDLIRLSRTPVLVVGENRTALQPFERIAAAIDLSPVSLEVLKAANAFALLDNAQLRTISAHETPVSTAAVDWLHPLYQLPASELEEIKQTMRKDIEKLIAQLPDAPTEISIETACKLPASQVLLERSQETDLLVLGTSGHNAVHRLLLGSTATKTIAEAACPVLVIPHNVKPLEADSD